MKLAVSLGAAAICLAQVALAVGPTGDTLETANEEVRVKAENFKDKEVQDLLTPNNLDPG